LPIEPNDFGRTLAVYGAEEGVFVMLPLLGPSTSRDAVGVTADFAADPFNFIAIPGGDAVGAARLVLPQVDARSRNAEIIDQILYESPDSYTTLRAAYVQNRRREIAGGETDVDALPDIFAD
jgi:phospholipid-binding lipoprotein MlaA